LETVSRYFLGNEEVKNCSEILQQLISLYSIMGCNMSLKLNFLHSFLFFSENMGAVSDEHGESLIRIFPKMKEVQWKIYFLTAAAVK